MEELENMTPENEQCVASEPIQQPQQVQQPQQPQPQQPQPQQPQPQQPQPQHYAAPASRSPFANSPYMDYRQTAAGYTYQRPVYTPPATPPQPAPKEKKGGFWKTFWISAGVAIVCCAITAASISAYWQQRNHNLTTSFDEKLEVLRQEIENNSHSGTGDSVSGTPNVNVDGGLTPAQVYARNEKSVVAITCVTMNGQIIAGESAGTGFILSADGYVASNYHVVSGAERISVTTSDGKEYEAKYIGGDESNDIALLKVEVSDFQPVTIGNSDVLIVGDQVAAIGNPLGELASTLTVGYISAKDRIITTDGTQINMLQTDAAINPGNSGGPLFNMKGEVIGITTAKYSGTTESGASIEGIGFAIPINDVIGMLEDLQVHGYIKGAQMGVLVSNVDETISQMYGLPMGVLVHEVVIGGAAQKGGIKAQDIIVNLGGYDIANMNDLTRALRQFEAGQTVSVTVYRNGSNMQLSLTLDEKPVNQEG